MGTAFGCDSQGIIACSGDNLRVHSQSKVQQEFSKK